MRYIFRQPRLNPGWLDETKVLVDMIQTKSRLVYIADLRHCNRDVVTAMLTNISSYIIVKASDANVCGVAIDSRTAACRLYRRWLTSRGTDYVSLLGWPIIVVDVLIRGDFNAIEYRLLPR